VVVAHHGFPAGLADVPLDACCDGNGGSLREQLETRMRLYGASRRLWAAANTSPAQEK